VTPDRLPTIAELLRREHLADLPEEPFPNDGWSGATMTLLKRPDGSRFVLKRDSLDRDWIARATADGPILREAWFAQHGPALPPPIRNPALGAGHDPETRESAVLMPDLTGVLFDWNAVIGLDQVEAVLGALAALHGHGWSSELRGGTTHWTPWRERLTLICRPSLERRGSPQQAVVERLLPGWDAWDRHATAGARSVIADLANDPQPLLDALALEPLTLLHGDLKLANVGIAADAIEVVDWQMVMVAPVAIELGWFLVSNVNALPIAPDRVLERYWALRGRDGARENDLAVLVGLLLRGWRKGYDAEARVTLASGVSAVDDLAWWCERAVEAADRIL
jgi:Phosphotransferase enzyme family